MAKQACAQILCADLWHIKDSEFNTPQFEAVKNGALAINKKGEIVDYGPANIIRKRWQASKTKAYKNSVLIPGFIDTHLHFPQIDMIGCHGESLLGWLDRYTYPEEIDFRRPQRAKTEAKRFFDQLLSHGTTTSLVFSSSNASATNALFSEGAKRGARAIIGKTSMDRHAPKPLLVDPETDLKAAKQLIKRWHGYDERLYYAVSPRFAPSCSQEMLATLAELFNSRDDLYMQTHFAESPSEIDWVKKLFPKHRDYLDVYASFGLLNARSVLAHAMHVDDSSMKRLQQHNCKIAHCPTSNSFLGSGLFPMRRFAEAGVDLSLGTDIGAGTSFSIWQTMSEAYKVQRLQNQVVTPEQLLYLATLGGAKALSLDKTIGNFAIGKQADIQVLQWDRSDLLRSRFRRRGITPTELLFACNVLHERQLISEVLVRGKVVYSNRD